MEGVLYKFLHLHRKCLSYFLGKLKNRQLIFGKRIDLSQKMFFSDARNKTISQSNG